MVQNRLVVKNIPLTLAKNRTREIKVTNGFVLMKKNPGIKATIEFGRNSIPIGDSYTYDAYGRLVGKTLPDDGVLTATYRNDNLVDTITHADGKIISFSYDAAKQLLSSSVNGNNTINYTYAPTGALTQAQNAQAIVKLSYDNDGRLTKELQDSIAVTSSYDADNNRINLSYLDQIINYTRNSIGQATQISNATNSFTFSYNANGFKSLTLFPNGINEQLSFNAAYELTGISSGGGTISYSHDNSGLVTSKNINGQSTGYGYDAIARLTSSGSDSYNYDVAGNNLQNSSVYNTTTNELTSNTDFNYSYDAAGNLLSKSNKLNGNYKNYTWNNRNQLLSVKSYNSQNELTQELSFTYGPLGRRLTKTVDGVTHKYLYDGMSIVAIMDQNQLSLSNILHGDSIDTPLVINTDNQSYYYHRDHQGNILALTDSSQIVVENYSYDAYGVTSHTQTITTNNPYAYTGREYDDNDLYYYRARYYDPSTQRFLSKDPIGFAGGDFNLYRYVLNDPVNFVDPLGLEFSDILPGIGTAIVEGVKGGAYAVSEAAGATADIARDGHPLAQTALGIAFVSEAVPLAIVATPSVVSAVYNVAPYSGPIVDFTYGFFVETGLPKGWGYLSSGAMTLYDEIKKIGSDQNSSPCRE